RAYFTVVRATRDLFRQSAVGMIYTDREFAGTFNRVGGVDTRFRLWNNWWLIGEAVPARQPCRAASAVRDLLTKPRRALTAGRFTAMPSTTISVRDSPP